MSLLNQDWHTLLLQLPSTRRSVQHQPWTPRYEQARMKLPYVLRASTYLGVRADPDPARNAVELALWAPPPEGNGAGYFTCFRLYLLAESIGMAVLFCFYDGTEKSS